MGPNSNSRRSRNRRQVFVSIAVSVAILIGSFTGLLVLRIERVLPLHFILGLVIILLHVGISMLALRQQSSKALRSLTEVIITAYGRALDRSRFNPNITEGIHDAGQWNQ